jgi:peptidoglycan/xylan/chitin deacetylase (PgdA/CDA1 family)
MYHRVSEAAADPIEGDYVLPTSLFAAQMRWLAASGRPVVPLAAVLDDTRPDGSVILTHDDGCETDATVAAPLLASLGFPATFFVSPERIGRPGYLSWDQLRLLARAGFAVGSHGLDHSLLGELSQAQLRRQLLESKSRLEQELGSSVDLLSLPGGSGGRRVLSAAREAGYRLTVGSRPGVVAGVPPPMVLPRIALRRGHGEKGFRAAVGQEVPFFVRQGLRHAAALLARTLLGTGRYARLRARRLRRAAAASPKR